MTKELSQAQQIAADIAAHLRARPERWGKGDRPRPQCLMEHISSRCNPSGLVFGELREAIRERIRAQGSMAHFVSEWNDEPSRTVDDVISLCEEVARG